MSCGPWFQSSRPAWMSPLLPTPNGAGPLVTQRFAPCVVQVPEFREIESPPQISVILLSLQ